MATTAEQVAFQNGFLVGMAQKGVVKSGVVKSGIMIEDITRPGIETRNIYDDVGFDAITYTTTDEAPRTSGSIPHEFITYTLYA